MYPVQRGTSGLWSAGKSGSFQVIAAMLASVVIRRDMPYHFDVVERITKELKLDKPVRIEHMADRLFMRAEKDGKVFVQDYDLAYWKSSNWNSNIIVNRFLTSFRSNKN